MKAKMNHSILVLFWLPTYKMCPNYLYTDIDPNWFSALAVKSKQQTDKVNCEISMYVNIVKYEKILQDISGWSCIYLILAVSTFFFDILGPF